MLYNKTMARPRKFENRMTRTLTLRVPDDLYDFLVQEAVDAHEGDLSAATRQALLNAQVYVRIFESRDPHAEVQAILDEEERQLAREAYYDHHGEWPAE